MDKKQISLLKGLHPGIFIARELEKRKLAKGAFAISINEYPQTLGAVTLGKRDLNAALAMKIEEALELEEGFLMLLQALYDYKKIKQRKTAAHTPDLSKFRPATFWDTRIELLDWEKQKRSIIKRVMERGNAREKAELKKFYGAAAVKEAAPAKQKPLKNVKMGDR